MIEIEPGDKELISDLVEALPRLKRYRLTESQKVFLGKLEAIMAFSKQDPGLAINEMIE